MAELIHKSTNFWYQTNGKDLISRSTSDTPGSVVYEDLDPGCCLIAECKTAKIAGSCFYHPRKFIFPCDRMSPIFSDRELPVAAYQNYSDSR